MGALAWRLVNAYADTNLPRKVNSGAELDQFDSLVNRLPVGGDMIGTILGFVLMAAAIGLLGAGVRMRVREPLLQVAVLVVTLLALAGPFIPR